MKAETSRLIPLEPIENVELFSVNKFVFRRFPLREGSSPLSPPPYLRPCTHPGKISADAHGYFHPFNKL